MWVFLALLILRILVFNSVGLFISSIAIGVKRPENIRAGRSNSLSSLWSHQLGPCEQKACAFVPVCCNNACGVCCVSASLFLFVLFCSFFLFLPLFFWVPLKSCYRAPGAGRGGRGGEKVTTFKEGLVRHLSGTTLLYSLLSRENLSSQGCAVQGCSIFLPIFYRCKQNCSRSRIFPPWDAWCKSVSDVGVRVFFFTARSNAGDVFSGSFCFCFVFFLNPSEAYYLPPPPSVPSNFLRPNKCITLILQISFKSVVVVVVAIKIGVFYADGMYE